MTRAISRQSPLRSPFEIGQHVAVAAHAEPFVFPRA
jgi:hypothetical protein